MIKMNFIAIKDSNFHFGQMMRFSLWGTASISKKSKLRTCKILYNYSDNPVTKGNLKIAPG